MTCFKVPLSEVDVPRVAKATSPSYPERVLVLFLPDDPPNSFRTQTFASEEERDARLSAMLEAGVEPINMPCSEPGCPCTFPTLLLTDDMEPADPRLRTPRVGRSRATVATRAPRRARRRR